MEIEKLLFCYPLWNNGSKQQSSITTKIIGQKIYGKFETRLETHKPTDQSEHH